MIRKKLLLVLIAAVLMVPLSAESWLRRGYHDSVLVERSELIVAGRLKRDSIEYIPHSTAPDEGHSWEHRATLVISEVLKGETKERELMIIIHYGLDPVVGGVMEREGTIRVNLRGNRKDYPKEIIEIVDTGNSGWSGIPLVKDAGQDNLWFLCRRTGRSGREFGGIVYGISDPEEVQPLELKEYFLAYMSRDPERAVGEFRDRFEGEHRGYAAQYNCLEALLRIPPWSATMRDGRYLLRRKIRTSNERFERAQYYLDHLELQRIVSIPGREERIEELLPYYKAHSRWGIDNEAAEAIKPLGDFAAPYLIKLFEEEPEEGFLRKRTIALLGEMGCRNAVPFLIDLLERHDRHWAKEMERPDWSREDATNSGANRRAYSETYAAVYALLRIGDHRARGVIELTRKRWRQIDFENPQILEACNHALKVFAESE